MKDHARRIGYLAFFVSGICAISSSVIVSLLQESRGFNYSVSGTLLSVMNIGNLAAGFLTGFLPGRIGTRATVLLLTAGYTLGYALLLPRGSAALLALGWLLVGLAKGCAINTCTLLVGDNAPDRTKGLNTMHACYACGALLCPMLAALAGHIAADAPIMQLAVLGGVLWLLFAAAPLGNTTEKTKTVADWSFLRSGYFWLLTALLFCQNAAENGVTGWLVMYFRDSGILTAAVSSYTITLLWGTTMVVRLLLAFVFPPQNPCRAIGIMAAGCVVFYIGLVLSHSQTPAVLLLLGFSVSIAGMNSTIVSCAGKMTSAASLGIMLPTAGLGAILMPWVIGLIAQFAGLRVGMAANVLPCAGMLVLAAVMEKRDLYRESVKRKSRETCAKERERKWG